MMMRLPVIVALSGLLGLAACASTTGAAPGTVATVNTEAVAFAAVDATLAALTVSEPGNSRVAAIAAAVRALEGAYGAAKISPSATARTNLNAALKDVGAAIADSSVPANLKAAVVAAETVVRADEPLIFPGS